MTKQCDCKHVLKKHSVLERRPPDERMNVWHDHIIAFWYCAMCNAMIFISDKGTALYHEDQENGA